MISSAFVRSIAFIFTVAAAGAAWVPPAHAQAVFRGPYLTDVTPDAVTVMWESPAATTGIIRYGLLSPAENTAASNAPATHHAVRLTGLSSIGAPGSDFVYELDVDGVVRSGRFFTAVEGDTPFSFIVYGDNRSSPEQHQQVVDALLLEQTAASFAVNTGDLVSDGSDETHWDTFFEIEAPFLATMPLYVSIGNHEVEGLSTWDIPRRIFDFPTAALAPASNSESHYHVVYGNTELIILNVEVDSLYTIDFLAGDQEAWLRDVLANPPPGVRHRFVFIHQGPYSSKRGRTGNFWLRQWLDDLKDAGVHVLFSGHDHYAERGFAENGMFYVIHGGGGAPLYDTLGPRVTNDHTIVYSETRLGYVVVNIAGPKVQVVIKGFGGEVVDQFTYGDEGLPGCTTPGDCGAPPQYACPGGQWACEVQACTYSCGGGGGLIACLNDQDCVDQIGDWCTGTPRCERPGLNPLNWYCLCEVPPDCTLAADCLNRPSPVPGCTGTWDCVTEACEFTVDPNCTPSEPDAGGAQNEDAATTPGEDAATAPIEDAGNNEPLPPDAGSTTTPGPDAGGLGKSDPEETCACTSVQDAHSSAWWLLLAFAALRKRSRD